MQALDVVIVTESPDLNPNYMERSGTGSNTARGTINVGQRRSKETEAGALMLFVGIW